MMMDLLGVIGPFDSTFVDLYFSCSKIRAMLMPMCYLIFFIAWVIFFSRKQRDYQESVRFFILSAFVMILISQWWNVIRPLTDAMAGICPNMKDNMAEQMARFSDFQDENNTKTTFKLSLWDPLTWFPYLMQSVLVGVFKILAAWSNMLMLGLGIFKWGAIFILWTVTPLVIPMLLIDELRQNTVKFILSNLAITLWPLAGLFVDLICMGLFKLCIHYFTLGANNFNNSTYVEDPAVLAGAFMGQAAGGIYILLNLTCLMIGLIILNTFLYMTVPKLAHELITGGNIASVVSGAMMSAAAAGVDAVGKAAGAVMALAGPAGAAAGAAVSAGTSAAASTINSATK